MGSNLKHPFKIKRLVGQSGMSYGALGKNAITALSMGLAKAGTWMNTGEGGLSEYHLKVMVTSSIKLVQDSLGKRS